MVYTTTILFTEISDIYILGVASGRHSKGLNMLRNYPLTRKLSVSKFLRCDIGGVKKFPCVLVHNITSSLLVQEKLNGRVRRNLESILKVNERCIEGCALPGQGTSVVCGVR